MKTRNLLILVVTLVISVAHSYGQTSYSFNDGLEAASSSGKMIFLDIYSPSDSWSQKMDQVYSDAAVKSALSGFVWIKLNAGSSDRFNYNKKSYSAGELAKLFGGTGYPTFVFMKPDGSVIKFKYNGEEVSNLSGFLGENDFAEMLEYFAQGKYTGTDLSSIFKN